jgi:hypothetical protein
MRAFFEPYHVRLDVVPGEPDLTRDGIPRVYDRMLETPTYRFVRGQENNPDESSVIVPAFLAFDELKIKPVSLPTEAWQPERRPWVIDAHRAAARQGIDTAEAAVAEAQEKLAAAETANNSQASGADSQTELTVAKAGAAVAKCELVSIERRFEAMRAAWAVADGPSDDRHAALVQLERQQTASAVAAERQVLVAKARHGVAVAQQSRLRAEPDKLDIAEEELKTARKSLDKAIATATAEIKPPDEYSPLAGAKWTPTRFLFSARDDPSVEFAPYSTGRRTALANWITDRRNPLTARVAVNHIWMRHMGAALVPTVFDFGLNGTAPTHPALLDWLASELMDSGWSMKHLHQLIVNSAAYRMTSSVAGGEDNKAKDPDNRHWWRRVPIRLESQTMRDSLLAHAGTLDPAMGGPPVLPAQQDESTRRSLYFFHSNNDRNLFLTTFDETLVKDCYRREQSIVPQQALALTNSKLILDASARIAERLSAEGDKKTGGRREQEQLTIWSFFKEPSLCCSESRRAMERSLPALKRSSRGLRLTHARIWFGR